MSENFSINDSIFMDRALQIAERGLTTTTPNPSVGCVIVASGHVIAEGHTQPVGKDHAEKHALASVMKSPSPLAATPRSGVQGMQSCGEGLGRGVEQGALHETSPSPRPSPARGEGEFASASSPVGAGDTLLENESFPHPSLQGATAYVTLEPCSHFGRTPPCADALIAAGIARVVVAMQDPNPLVAGKGIARLRAAGIVVECGLRQQQASELIIGFVQRMTLGRPWVRSKIACSLDGKTALANGQSKWITGPKSRADGHKWRARSCAVLTGIGTVIDDNPRLNVRDAAGLPAQCRQPLRVIVDSDLRTPPNAAVLAGGALIFCATSDASRKIALEKSGAEVIVLPNVEGKVDLEKAMHALAARGINEVLVEAGSRLNGAMLDAELIDELLIYQAPIILGDDARGMFSGKSLTLLGDAKGWLIVERGTIGVDGFFRARRAGDVAKPN